MSDEHADPDARDGDVKVERDGAVVVLTLDRPKVHNALDRAMVHALVRLVGEADADEAARAIVLTGAGARSFCSGGDLKMLATIATDRARGADVLALGDALSLLERIDLPVIAAVQGDAFGGGCELLLLADLAIVESHARLGFRHAKMGLSPAWGGLTRLVERVGPAAAAKALFTAASIDAADAVRMGLADEVVPSGGSRARALEIAARIGENSRASVAALKRALRGVREELRAGALAVERAAFLERWGGPDQLAALASRSRS